MRRSINLDLPVRSIVKAIMKQLSARAQTITLRKKFRRPGKLASLLLTLACLPVAIFAADAPVLSISNAGNTVMMSWTTNSPGYTLQTNGNLAVPGAWADFPVTYNIAGPNYQVTVPIAAAPQFYRLKGSGTTFYVDPAGNNANTGLSLAQAWQTISYALTNAAFTNCFFTNATTLVLTGGDVFMDTNAVLYGDNIKYPLLVAGSGASPAVISNYYFQKPSTQLGWTFMAYEPNMTTFSNLAVTGQHAWLVTQQSSNVNYSGLAIVNTNTTLCHDIAVKNCMFTCSYFGIHFYTTSSGMLSNMSVQSSVFNSNICSGLTSDAFTDGINWKNKPNAISNLCNLVCSNLVASNSVGDIFKDGGTGYGFTIINMSNAIVTGCVVHDSGELCYNSASDGGASGMMAARAFGVVFSSNEIYNIHWNGSVDGDGLDFDNNSWGCIAEYNYVHNCDGAGLYAYNSYGGNTWRFNVSISNSLQTGYSEFALGTAGNTPTNNLVYNNNFIDLVGNGSIFIMCSLGGSNVFANNIFFTTNSYALSTVDTTHVTFATNDYFRGDGSQAAFYWNGTTYSSFAAWTAATGQDLNGFHADPKWVNGYTVITNYPAQMSGITGWTLLSASSPLINQATGPYGFASGGIDFLGVDSLGATFNVGAVNASQ